MATYSELRALFSDDDLRHRVETAVVIAAEAELAATPGSVEGRAWGLKALQDPGTWGRKAFILVLAANKGASVAAIQMATDTTIQAAVDAITPGCIAAEAGV
jgi:hypothetical protein